MHHWVLGAAGAYALGIVVGDAAPQIGAGAQLAAWCVLALALGLRGARFAPGRLGALWLALALLGCHAMSKRVATDELRAPGEALLEARVAKLAQTRSGWRIELRDVHALSGRAPSGILLWLDTRRRAPQSADDARAIPKVGARIRTRLTLRPFQGLRNPGGRDSRARARRSGLGAWASLDANEPWAEVRAPRFAARRALFEWRRRSAARLAEHGAGGGLLAALALGERSGLPSADRTLAARGGVAHLLAVSGLHLALVAGAAFALATLLLRAAPGARQITARFLQRIAHLWRTLRRARAGENTAPQRTRAGRALARFAERLRARRDALQTHDRRAPALWAALLAACAYAVLTGWNPPVQRALLFLLLLLAGAFSARVVSPAPRLAVAGLGVLVWDPSALFEPGPQLSFVAVAALMLQRGEQGAPQGEDEPLAVRIKAAARAILRSSASATAATAPLVAHHIGVAAPLGWLANALAIPATGLLLLPLALLAALVAGFDPPGAALVLALATRCADFALAALRLWSEAAPTAPWCALAHHFDLSACAAAPAPWWCALLAPGGDACSASATPVLSPGALALLASAALALATLHCARTLPRLLGVVLTVSALVLLPPARWSPAPPRVVFFDVGGGDALLVQGRAASVLIDAGDASPGGRDDGARIVLPALAALGVRALDLVVASHADRDHRGGLPSVLAALPVGALWLPPDSAREPGFARVRAAAHARGVPIHERGAGAHWRRGDVSVRGLWPPAGLRGSRNARSLAVALEVAGHRVLAMGDLDAAGEAALLARKSESNFLKGATLLKLGHHGSRSSSSEPFLRATAPRLAVVSAAGSGHFGFPHPVVRARLQALRIPWAWTGRDGALLVGLDPFCVRALKPDARLPALPVCASR